MTFEEALKKGKRYFPGCNICVETERTYVFRFDKNPYSASILLKETGEFINRMKWRKYLFDNNINDPIISTIKI